MSIEHLLQAWFLSAQFMPHGSCYLWNPALIWLHTLSDGAIALAYYSIPVELAYFARKRTDLPFAWILSMFVFFIFSCGTTHLLAIVTIWRPIYWADGMVKAVTAILSIGTAVALIWLIPQALALHGEDKFRSLLESAPDAMVIVDHQGRIVLVNAQTEKLFGYKREELVGKVVEMLVPERSRERHVTNRKGYFAQPQWRAMDGGRDHHGLRKDGSEFPVEVNLGPITTGGETLVCGAVRDATEKKKADAEVRKLNESLRRHSAQLEAANRELEAFSYSVSHDLRAPLRSIDGFGLALAEDYGDKLDDQARAYLDRIRSATQRMAHLIDDLLELSRVARVEISRQPVDLSAKVKAILAELGGREPDRCVECVVVEGIVGRGDPWLLQVALENLLGNAWKFTSNKSQARIEFGATYPNGDPVYFVRDNGAGFDMKYAAKLFGPFQRLHAAGEFPGTGVGLAIVQRIINRHGGRIWASGAEGKGAIFSFTLEQSERKHDDGGTNDPAGGRQPG